MESRSSESAKPVAAPPVLEYARPLARKTSKFPLIVGFIVSGALILLAVLLLILGAMLCWSSVEVARTDNSGMQLGGIYALLTGAVLLMVGMAGRRMATRQ